MKRIGSVCDGAATFGDSVLGAAANDCGMLATNVAAAAMRMMRRFVFMAES